MATHTLLSGKNHPRQPLSQPAQQLVGNGARLDGHSFCGEWRARLGVHKGGGVAQCRFGNVCHIYSQLIHTDVPYHRGHLSVN